jgi:hypothetical protein
MLRAATGRFNFSGIMAPQSICIAFQYHIMNPQDQNSEHLDIPRRSTHPLFPLSSETSGSSLQGLMGNISPQGRLTPDTTDERSKFLDDNSAQVNYGSVNGSVGSAGESLSASDGLNPKQYE